MEQIPCRLCGAPAGASCTSKPFPWKRTDQELQIARWHQIRLRDERLVRNLPREHVDDVLGLITELAENHTECISPNHSNFSKSTKVHKEVVKLLDNVTPDGVKAFVIAVLEIDAGER